MSELSHIILSVPGFADPVSSWTHLLAAGGVVLAAIALLRAYRDVEVRLWGPFIFAASAVFLFAMSGTYHLLDHGGEGRAVMQRMDHAAIWVLIAGTFTAIHAVAFTDRFWRFVLPGLIWSLAITGLVLKTVFFHEMPEVVGSVFYLALGWIGVVSAWKLKRESKSEALSLMIGGGVAYSIGAVIEAVGHPTLITGVIGPHEIFHMAVIAGVILHWRCMRGLLDQRSAPTTATVTTAPRAEQLLLRLEVAVSEVG